MEHLHRYQKSDGADGHLWDSTGFGDHGLIPTLLLTTTGRQSAELLIVPLIYTETDGRFVVVASAGGAPTNPAWCINLMHKPEVDIQVIANKFAAIARVSEGKEREELWRVMNRVYPEYIKLQAKTERQIPVIVLDPVSKQT
ncbi:MAG: nitroreductase family deazaflavin-dependent oxidoreductase [Gammaproteobacteria bacterium]|nr:nitroreductase family deazaflavin-dependent oxidoreductase [Gammaproteobacteria bacterium]